jgi:hypothetical protein
MVPVVFTIDTHMKNTARLAAFIAPVAVVLFIAGCAGPDVTDPVFIAQGQLVGKTGAYLLACAGEPDERTKNESRETWAYNIERGGPGDYGYCQVKFALDNGVVKKLSYKIRTNDNYDHRRDLCRELIPRCTATR